MCALINGHIDLLANYRVRMSFVFDIIFIKPNSFHMLIHHSFSYWMVLALKRQLTVKVR